VAAERKRAAAFAPPSTRATPCRAASSQCTRRYVMLDLPTVPYSPRSDSSSAATSAALQNGRSTLPPTPRVLRASVSYAPRRGRARRTAGGAGRTARQHPPWGRALCVALCAAVAQLAPRQPRPHP
jgi:hypothetical protein